MYLWPYQVGGGGGLTYVDRPDPGTEDFDLTIGGIADGNWHDWDISAIVPLNAKLVLFQTFAINDTANKGWMIRHKGDYSTQKAMNQTASVAGQYFGVLGFVAGSPTGLIEYKLDTGCIWYWAEFTIVGWFV